MARGRLSKPIAHDIGIAEALKDALRLRPRRQFKLALCGQGVLQQPLDDRGSVRAYFTTQKPGAFRNAESKKRFCGNLGDELRSSGLRCMMHS